MFSILFFIYFLCQTYGQPLTESEAELMVKVQVPVNQELVDHLLA